MNKYTEAIQGDDVVILCDGIPMGVGEILAALNAATPPADAALADAVAPGVMRCAKCKFGLQRVILSVRSGTASAGNSKTEPCPNGCGPLWPVTWKELAKEHLEVAERFFDESAVLRKDNETLRAELTALRARPQAVAEAVAKDVFSGVTHIDAGFNYSTETRLTTPSVTLFFEPGNGEKNSTWLARDAFRERLHAILSATDTKEGRSNG